MNVGIYTRVSTQEQAKDGYSISEQSERLKQYCEAMGWTVYKTFTDAGFSGANMNRPALQDMIRSVETGKIKKVVVYKLDRLSRRQLDTLYLIETVFLEHGCDFVSMCESFDTSTAFGRATIGLLAVFAQLERDMIRDRLIMGKDARAKEGKWTGSKPPMGYDYTKETGLTVNQFEAMQIRELFDLCISGTPLNKIETIFREKGYRQKNGNQWTLWSLKYMLENRTYIGLVRHGEEWIPGIHEPIIDEETFAQAGRRLQAQKTAFAEAGYPSGGNHRSTLLGGLLFCSRCGARYTKRYSGNYNHRTETYVCYSRMKTCKKMVRDPNCKNKIYRVEELNKIILGEIEKLSLEPDPVPSESDEKEKIRLLQTEIQKIDQQISRFLDLYGLGTFTAEQLDEKIIPLQDRRKKLQDEISRLDLVPISRSDAITLLDAFREIIENGSLEEQRETVQALIHRIDIDGDDLTIQWKF